MIKIANNLLKLSVSKEDVAGFLNPSSSNAENYAAFGIGGGSIGALSGLLIEALRDKKEKNYLKAFLMGGGIGSIAGLGTKAVGDISSGALGERERQAKSPSRDTGLTRADLVELLPQRLHAELLRPTALDRWEGSGQGDMSAWGADWAPRQIPHSKPRPESERSKNDSNKSKSETKKTSSMNALEFAGAMGALGAGVGGFGGAGIGALIELLKNEEEKNYLKSMLQGAGLGAGLGGLTGVGIGGLGQLLHEERIKGINSSFRI